MAHPLEDLRTAVAVARERRITVMAAGLAYYAFNSLIPAVFLVFVAVSVSGRLESFAFAVAAMTGVEPLQLNDAFRTATANPGGRVRAAVIAAAIFLWSTGRMFRAIRGAFTEMYGAGDAASPLRALLDVALAFLTFGLAVVLLAVIGVSLTYVFTGTVWLLVSPVLLFLTLVVVFLPMYYVFPHTDVSLREAAPGTVFAAATWALSGVVFRSYAATSTGVALYGLAGGVLLLLTWFYLGGLVLLLGVTLNAVRVGRVEVDGPSGS